MKSYLLIASALLSSSAFADQMVTLQDGKQVLLKDDFTWQYMAQKQAEEVATTSEIAVPVAAVPVVAVPVTTNTRGTTIVVNSKKPSLQLSQSGVDVVLGASRYEGGELIIPTAITNQGTQAVILVSLNISIFTAEGTLLAEEEVAVWKSIKRMADTYLRPKTGEEGKLIKLDLEQHPEYQIKAEITEVLAR
ncbi:Ribonuclease [Vibrio crassostreae]|nr:Ribonuclease [Vibrio crassostreae]CAK3309536.1 Ribonuclease [Vibrio crassostreae]